MQATNVMSLPVGRNVVVKITMHSDFCRVGRNATFQSKGTIQALSRHPHACKYCIVLLTDIDWMQWCL